MSDSAAEVQKTEKTKKTKKEHKRWVFFESWRVLWVSFECSHVL